MFYSTVYNNIVNIFTQQKQFSGQEIRANRMYIQLSWTFCYLHLWWRTRQQLNDGCWGNWSPSRPSKGGEQPRFAVTNCASTNSFQNWFPKLQRREKAITIYLVDILIPRPYATDNLWLSVPYIGYGLSRRTQVSLHTPDHFNWCRLWFLDVRRLIMSSRDAEAW